MGIIYMVQPAELANTNRYKVGCSRETNLKRIITGYNHNTKVIVVEDADDPFKIEKMIIDAFATRFECIGGREFFAGDVDQMKDCFKEIVKELTKKQEPIVTTIEPLQCKKCGRLMCRKDYLKIHEASCDGVQAKQCEICLKVFTTYQGKYQHKKHVKCSPPDVSSFVSIDQQLIVPSNTIQQPTNAFQCIKCDKILTSKRNLINHEERCKGLKPNQCEICLKVFATRQSKYKHNRYVKCIPPDTETISFE